MRPSPDLRRGTVRALQIRRLNGYLQDKFILGDRPQAGAVSLSLIRRSRPLNEDDRSSKKRRTPGKAYADLSSSYELLVFALRESGFDICSGEIEDFHQRVPLDYLEAVAGKQSAHDRGRLRMNSDLPQLPESALLPCEAPVGFREFRVENLRAGSQML